MDLRGGCVALVGYGVTVVLIQYNGVLSVERTEALPALC